MKILLAFTFLHYIWFIDSENLCFIERKSDKLHLTVAPHLTVSKFNKPRGALIRENTVNHVQENETCSG